MENDPVEMTKISHEYHGDFPVRKVLVITISGVSHHIPIKP